MEELLKEILEVVTHIRGISVAFITYVVLRDILKSWRKK